jgi:conserved repeat domain
MQLHIISLIMVLTLSLNSYLVFVDFAAASPQESSIIIKENLKITQIYNETIFILNITAENSKPIFSLINEDIDNIQYFGVVIYNLNLTDRTLRWFFSDLNPIKDFPFLMEKGFLVKMSVKSDNLEQIILNKLSDKFKTKFVKIESDYHITGGKYGLYIDDFLLSLNYTYKGFYNLNEYLKPVGIKYEIKGSIQQLIFIYITPFAVSPDIYSKRIFNINYSRYLENITSSEFSSESKIEFFLYGMAVHESIPKITWLSSYENNWVTYSYYNIGKNERVGKVSLNCSKLDPFVLVTQTANPGVFNSTTKLYILIYNYGTVDAYNITVKVNLPSGITANNDTLVFSKVSPNQFSKKYLELSSSINESKIFEFPPPEVYWKLGNTVIKTVGNPLKVGYKVASFASLSYIIFPNKVAGELHDILNIPTEFKIIVNNTGNVEAKNVKLILDYLNQNIGDIKHNDSSFMIFEVEPYKFKIVPNGSVAIPGFTITYEYNNKTEKLESKNPYFYTFSSYFSYVNYLSLTQQELNNVISPPKINLAWSSIALGSPRLIIINSTLKELEKQGIKYSGPDSFTKKEDRIEVRYSFNRGDRHTISLALNFSNYSHYIITPIYQYVEPFQTKILVPPLVFSSAILVKKETNSTLIGVGSYLNVTVILSNLSNDTIYNVDLYDEIPIGWKFISGLNRTFASSLKPKTNLTLTYIIEAIEPTFNYLPSAKANYYFFGNNWNSISSQVNILIKLIVKFKILDWNMKNLTEAILRIKDSKGNLLGNYTVKNGILEWEGFVGSITIDVIFRNQIVNSNSFYLTSKNTSITIKTYVFDLNLSLKDIFGLNIKNAKVYLESSNLTIYPNAKGNLLIFEGIPKGLYYLNIEIGNYKYKVPIVIDERFSQNINMGLPLIEIGSIILDLQTLIAIILLFFLAFFIYITISLRKK